MPRILLTGKNGQVGFALNQTLAVLGDVTAVDVHECDLTKPDAIRDLILTHRPDVIVHPAAYTAVDKAESEQELAYAINAVASGVIGEVAAQIGAPVFTFSTDYVYPGDKDGWYQESDATGPLSVYGKTKLAGEVALAAAQPKHVTLRTSWVFGPWGGNFLKTMLRLAKDRDALNVVADQYGAPTSANLLADVTAQLVARYLNDVDGEYPWGTYHLVAGGETNWHGYAKYVIEHAAELGWNLQVKPDAIKPIPASDYPVPAPRPSNSRLDTTLLRETFGLSLPDWQHGVRHTLALLSAGRG